MAVRLITENERNVFEYDGTKFYYRRVGATQTLVINKKHTKRGITDFAAVGYEIVEYCLLDWENMEGADGELVPFSKELIKQLPDDVIQELSTQIRESSPVDKQLGN